MSTRSLLAKLFLSQQRENSQNPRVTVDTTVTGLKAGNVAIQTQGNYTDIGFNINRPGGGRNSSHEIVKIVLTMN